MPWYSLCGLKQIGQLNDAGWGACMLQYWKMVVCMYVSYAVGFVEIL